eukprot:352193-Chlamydomonas_euryale.AAC.32
MERTLQPKAWTLPRPPHVGYVHSLLIPGLKGPHEHVGRVVISVHPNRAANRAQLVGLLQPCPRSRPVLCAVCGGTIERCYFVRIGSFRTTRAAPAAAWPRYARHGDGCARTWWRTAAD